MNVSDSEVAWSILKDEGFSRTKEAHDVRKSSPLIMTRTRSFIGGCDFGRDLFCSVSWRNSLPITPRIDVHIEKMQNRKFGID